MGEIERSPDDARSVDNARRQELERMKVTMKRFSVQELARHLNDYNPAVKEAALRAVREMENFGILDPNQVNVAPIRLAYMRFQDANRGLMPTQGGVSAVIRAVLDLHAVKKKIVHDEEGGKKPKKPYDI